MKIAYFHTGTILSSWTNWALADTLRRLGHDVIDAKIPCEQSGAVKYAMKKEEFAAHAAALPSLESLRDCEVILVFAPEYIHGWLHALYGKEKFQALSGKRVLCFAESSRREDVETHFEKILDWGNVLLFPDKDDVHTFKGHHLKPCVDTEMFRKLDIPKFVDAGFAGTLYPKRFEFLKQLGADVVVMSPGAVDVKGPRPIEWTKLYVHMINGMKIHVCLPSNNSKMMVARPLETMACGTLCLTHRTADNPFVDATDLCIYDSPVDCADAIQYLLETPEFAEEIANTGMEFVRKHHSSDVVWKEVLEIAVA